jgi:hypothetical protein
MIKIVLFCSLSTDVPDAPFVVTSSADGEQRPIYEGLYTIGGYGDGYFFLYMDGRIIYGLVHHHLLMQSIIAQIDMYFAFLTWLLLDGCVHLSYAETTCNCLNF